MKKVFLLVLLATFAIAAYGQTDSTKVKKKKKKKKIDWVSVHGTVADSFTKMGILDVKTILMEEDSTVISIKPALLGQLGRTDRDMDKLYAPLRSPDRQLPLLSEAEERNRRAGLSA